MCLATLTLDGATLSEEQIRNAWNKNPHGGGIAYFGTNGKIQSFRTLSLPKFIRGYARLLEDGAHESPMAIHFRLATHGDRTIANVHPFRMDANTLVIHNGMFPIDEIDDRSDTCIFVTETLAKLGPLWMDDANLRNLVEGYCDAGYANKLVVLTDNPDAKFRAYIVNQSAGHWSSDKRIWFSNRSHESPEVKRWNPSWFATPNETWDASPDDPEDEWRECGMCGENGVAYLDESGTDVCYLCGTCVGCAMEWEDCTCGPAIRFHEQTDAQIAMFTN